MASYQFHATFFLFNANMRKYNVFFPLLCFKSYLKSPICITPRLILNRVTSGRYLKENYGNKQEKLPKEKRSKLLSHTKKSSQGIERADVRI